MSAWFKNFNRYNNGSEEQFWLSVFSAKTTISDRKNAKSSIFIKRPYISVIGTIQKKILSELAKGERSSNGFIDRILFVMPNLQQKARWNDKELPENIEQEWNAIIDKLIQQEYALNEFGEIEPQILLFTEDAKRRLYEWQHHFSELCDQETNDIIVSIYCKLEIYIIRFCLIIQLARWTCGECGKTYIDLLTVERAIKLTEYFKESALSVQNMKVLITIVLLLAVWAGYPLEVMAQQANTAISRVATPKDKEKDSVEISAYDNKIVVENAPAGSKLEIYSVVGIRVKEIPMKQPSGEYTVDIAKGYYIVRIGDTVRKVSIR